MATFGMPLDTLVSVTTTVSTPAIPIEQNPNLVLYATETEPINPDALPFKTYTKATDVATDYGLDSDTYKFANTLFSQQPSILAGNGNLTIAPYNNDSSPPTSGYWQSTDLTGNLANFQTTTDGYVQISVDGVPGVFGPIDFTGVNNFLDVALRIQPFIIESANISGSTNGIRITSRTVGSTSIIGVLTPIIPIPPGPDIGAVGFLNGNSGTVVPGTDAGSEEQSLPELIQDLLDLPNRPVFFTVITDRIMDNTEMLATSNYFQATASTSNPMLFVYTFNSLVVADPTIGIASQITSLGNSQTRMLINGIAPTSDSPVNFRHMTFAYTGKLCSVNFDLPNSAGQAIPGNKTLVGVTSDSVTETQKNLIQSAGLDAYYLIAGIDSIFASGANSWFDTIYFGKEMIPLKTQSSFDSILRPNKVITANSLGDSVLKAQANLFWEEAKACGFVTSGVSWDGVLPAGLPQSKADAFYAGILNNGYFVYIPPLATRTPLQKVNRQSTPINNYVMLTGSVQTLQIYVTSQSS